MIFSMFQSGARPNRVRRAQAARFQVALEGLEERTVMSVAAMAHVAHPAAHVAPPANSAASLTAPLHVTGVSITGLTQNAQGLVTGAIGTVTGTLAGQSFTTPLTVSSATAAAKNAVPVLNLHLGAIDLNVLGLEVKTSEICLNITAQRGPGNLLGNLVGGLANALNGTQSASGTGLLNTLNGLLGTAGNATSATTAVNSALSTVLPAAKNTGSNSINGILSGVLGAAFNKATASAATTAQNILHLSIAPLNLNLLGLVIHLDNCNNGPVTVDVNAIPGSGNLLGNLLASVSHLLDTPNLIANFDKAVLSTIGNAKAPTV